MRLRPSIAALILVAAAVPAAAQNVRDSVRSEPQAAQSQMAAPPAHEAKATTAGTVSVEQIPVGEAKSAPAAATPPALGTAVK